MKTRTRKNQDGHLKMMKRNRGANNNNIGAAKTYSEPWEVECECLVIIQLLQDPGDPHSTTQMISCSLIPKCSEFHLNWRKVVSFPNVYQNYLLLLFFIKNTRLFQDQGDPHSAFHNPDDLQAPLVQLPKL